MQPSPESSEQKDLIALIQKAQRYAPVPKELRSVNHKSTRAAAGEIWLTRTPEGKKEDSHEPLTVLILGRTDAKHGAPTLLTGAPIFTNPSMAGPSDAVLPREIFGFEAGISFSSAGSLLTESLVSCEGRLPREWTSKLTQFYDFVRGVEKSRPAGLTTGAPYIDEKDSAFTFHEELAEQMQALASPVLDWVAASETDTSTVPGWFSVEANKMMQAMGDIRETLNEYWDEYSLKIPQVNSHQGMGGVVGGAMVGLVLGGLPGGIIGGLAGNSANIMLQGTLDHFTEGARKKAKEEKKKDRKVREDLDLICCKIKVGDTGAKILLEVSISKGEFKFKLKVLEDPNHVIEGAQVIDAGGAPVATITQGESAESFNLEGDRMLLRLREGGLVPLQEVAIRN